jgi:hypothetical protein
MAGLYYFVRVAKSESLARFGSSELLVQLVCQDHGKFFESHRERYARQLALVAMVDRHHSAAEEWVTRTRRDILVTFRQISEPPIFLHHAGALPGIGRELDRYQVTELNAVRQSAPGLILP